MPREADSRGNITSETRNGVTVTYEYDELGQLTRVNDPGDPAADSDNGTTWLFTYDRGGNILSKQAYVLSTAAQPTELRQNLIYGYTDANWKDKLTHFCNDELTYDAIGNLTGDIKWTYVWEKGRQLKSMHNAASGVTMEFKYNHEGLRTRKVKKVNGAITETTDYILKGKLIAAMKKNTDTYYFTYNAFGKPVTVNFNGTKYTYVKNFQGDIVGILDASGTLIVEYKYDAWGDAVSIYSASTAFDDLAFDNPFRYRGYVWDEETGLYYLSSRYYNPEIGRFINADIIVSTGQGILGSNMFAYCLNNPVCRRDASGDTSRKNKGENDFNHTDDYKEFAGGRIDNDGVYSSGNTNGGSNGGTGNSGTNNSTIQIGGGHGSKMHAAKINRFIEALKKARQFLKIYGNRALKTAGLEGNQRPDVIAYKIDGRIEVWEFASPSQAIGTKGYQDLEAKIKAMQAANPSVHFYPIIPWEDN